jgi:hypothetical protein
MPPRLATVGLKNRAYAYNTSKYEYRVPTMSREHSRCSNITNRSAAELKYAAPSTKQQTGLDHYITPGMILEGTFLQ